MRILLHAGHFKTGTTAFQQALNRHKDALWRDGVLVPEMPRGNHGYVINPLHPERFTQRMAVLYEEIAQAEAQGARWTILSAEVLAHLKPKHLAQIREALARWPIEAMVVLRAWSEFLPSRYTQNVRGGDFIGFDDWLSEITATGHGHPDTNFSLVLQRLGAVFDQVCVCSYVAGAPWGHFLQRVEVPAISPSTGALSVAANPRMSWVDREVLRYVNVVAAREDGRSPASKHARAADPDQVAAPVGKYPTLQTLREHHPAVDRDVRATIQARRYDLDWWWRIEPSAKRWLTQLQGTFDERIVAMDDVLSLASPATGPEPVIADSVWREPAFSRLAVALQSASMRSA